MIQSLDRLGIFVFFLLIFCLRLSAQRSAYPLSTVSDQSEILYTSGEELVQVDHSAKATGYWIYYSPETDISTAPLVVFVHGYGGYNPMIYGSWIRHLVRQGKLVIYPRYQRNIIFPSANKFAENAATGIKDAIAYLQKEFAYNPPAKADYVGHSYGGTIISDYLVHYKEYGIPKPHAALLCAPGTSSLKGGRLKSYEGIDPDVHLAIVEENNDWVVGNEFSRKVFSEAPEEMKKALIINYSQALSSAYYDAHHNVCYALDDDFDNQLRNYTAKRALEIGRTDELDYNFYWRLFDLLCMGNNEALSIIYEKGSFPVSVNNEEGLQDRYIFKSKQQLTAQE